jgi:membrane glycosyltransferase
LRPISRAQLALAILMFIGSPAWILMVVVATFRGLVIDSPGPVFRPETGLLLFLLVMAMTFAPKIASVLDVLTRPGGPASFGGTARFLVGVLMESLFFTVLAPIMAVAHTVFMGGLVLGRAIGWTSQVRDDHLVPFNAAAKRLWVQTLCGAALGAWFVVMAPGAIGYGLPFFLPLLLAIPFAMASALPSIGRAMARVGLAAIPEDVAPPPELLRLELPALAVGRRPAVSQDVPAGA